MKLWIKPTRGSGSPWRRVSRGLAGFTLAEVLAALVIMAIVIPAAVEGLRIANRAGVVAQRKGVATQLADSLLNELIVTKNWNNSAQSGTFSPEWPGYRWRVQTEPWGRETMRLVSVEVTYEVQNKEYRVVLSTLAPPL